MKKFLVPLVLLMVLLSACGVREARKAKNYCLANGYPDYRIAYYAPEPSYKNDKVYCVNAESSYYAYTIGDESLEDGR